MRHWARQLWGRTSWARLGRIAAALEQIEACEAERHIVPAPQPAKPTDPPAPTQENHLDTRGISVWRRLGLTLLLDGSSPVDHLLIESGFWEPEQIAKLRDLAMAAMRSSTGPRVFLDVGAYFGLYALVFERLRLFDRIIAFEPDRLNFAQLQAQLFLNDAAYRIEARNEAVGAESATWQMNRSDMHPTGNRGGVGVWHCTADSRCMPVNVITIDDLGLSDGLVVAKIDVEGYQDCVLRGMRETIARNVCILQVEAYEGQRPATLALLSELDVQIVAEVSPDLFAINNRPPAS